VKRWRKGKKRGGKGKGPISLRKGLFLHITGRVLLQQCGKGGKRPNYYRKKDIIAKRKVSKRGRRGFGYLGFAPVEKKTTERGKGKNGASERTQTPYSQREGLLSSSKGGKKGGEGFIMYGEKGGRGKGEGLDQTLSL